MTIGPCPEGVFGYATEGMERFYTAAAAAPLLDQDEDQMKLSQMIESKYLKQTDVEDETLVTVRGLKKVNVARDDEDPEYRWTVKYDEFDKPMVLNATNIKRMGKALGDDTDDWIGKQVILYVDPDIEFGGNVVGGLRVKAARNPAAKARKAVGMDDTEEVNRKFREAVDDGSVPF